ncbi:RHS repeat domain-containing protein [Alistipes sp.]|uniref:RHS repeat domain-containing protein n=1 Tax=Alistipes sp. TaxID=1872444 RepID=UPI003A888FBD
MYWQVQSYLPFFFIVAVIPNGNISSDALSGLEISYNVLNLPSKLYGWGDYSDYYLYLADGTKIQHEYSDGQQDDYRGSLVYYSNGQFSAPFGGGRLVSKGNTTEAHYFLTDHLGSTRVVAKVTPTGRIDLDRKDYYPFGKEWKQSGMPTSSNAYLFSGKERQDIESDDSVITPLYDFGARFYDPAGVTFLQQDPLMEKYYSIGQYVYCAENPIRFIDSDGRKIRENSKHLKPHMQRILNRTPTGRIQYNKIVNNESDISVKRVEGYYVNENGVVDRNRMGNASLTVIMKNPETGEIIGGRIDITLYMEAIKDDAKKRGMRVDDREAATLAEEIEHTEAKNIRLQIEEREREAKEKQEKGTEVEIPYEKKESEQKAHIFRDRVLRESEVEP